MLKNIVFIGFLFFSFNGLSKDQVLIDSLNQKLNQQIPTTLRIDIYNKLAWQFKSSDRETALEYAAKALEMAYQEDYLKGKATAHIRMAYMLRNIPNYDSALWHGFQSLAIEESENNLAGVGRAKNEIAIIYKKQGKYWKAVPIYKDALTIFNQEEKWSASSLVMTNLGLCYLELGAFEEAIELFLPNLEFYESNQRKKQLADTHLNLSLFYLKAKNGIKAVTHARQSLELAQSLKLPLNIVKSQINLGLALNSQDQFGNAIVHFENALQLSQKHNYRVQEQNLLNHLGNLYRRKGAYNKAIEYLNQCLALDPPIKTQAWATHNLGLVQKENYKFAEAQISFKNALELNQQTKDIFSRLKILKDLGALYAQQKQFDIAYAYNIQHINLSDSLNESYRFAMHYKDAYEAEQYQKAVFKERSIAQQEHLAKLEAESEYQKLTNVVILIVSGLLLTIATVFILYFRSRRELEVLKRQQERQILGAMLEGQEAERQRISEDLMGHLGSTLAGAQMFFGLMKDDFEEGTKEYLEHYKEGVELLSKAGEKIRSISYSIFSITLNKFGLLAALEDLAYHTYQKHEVEIKLIQDKFEENRMPYSIELAAFRILQDWLAQTIEHSDPFFVRIYLSKNDKILNILVEDNGNGFNLESADFKGGMGMAQIQGRLNAFGGEYAIVKGTIDGKGTTMVFDIPLVEDVVFQEHVI